MDSYNIIIPSYNLGEIVVKAINSVYSPNHEIIVVDDCSVDDSIKIIEETFRTRVRLVRNTKHTWVSAIRNSGMKLSTGEYIFFIDGDAYLKDGTIEMLIKECEDVDIVYPLIKLEDGNKMHPRNKREEKYPRMATAFLIKRRSLNRLDEYFDEDYKYTFEDEDFFTRCELLGLKSKFVPEVVVIHTKMPTNVISRTLRYNNQHWRWKLYFFHKNRLLYYLKFREYSLLDAERFSLNSVLRHLIYDVRHRDLESLLAFLLAVVWILLDLGKIERKRIRIKTMIRKNGLKVEEYEY